MKKSYLNDRFFSRLEALAFNLKSNLSGYFGGKHLVNTYGQTVEFENYVFQITEVGERRIEKVRMTILARRSEEDDTAGSEEP